MRLMMIDHSNPGGVETVNIEVIREFLDLVELVLFVMPAHRIAYYKKILPTSDRLVYASLEWPEESWFVLLRRLDGLVRRIAPDAPLRRRFVDLRLQQLVRTHGITHCFCTWIFGEPVPDLPVPIGAMVMDLNWRFFPENFSRSTAELDGCFVHWLNEPQIIFPVSEFTLDAVQKYFPGFRAPARVVPHGSTVHPLERLSLPEPPPVPLFFYPASRYRYKNHRALMAAAVILAERGHRFEIVFTGKDTDTLVGDTSLGPDVEPTRQFYLNHRALLSQHLRALGFCPASTVEHYYKSCTAVVLPTLYEGFGLPLIEALGWGARVICSDIAPFREQIGRYDCAEFAEIYPAHDTDALVQCMERAILEAERYRRPAPEVIANKMGRWTWRHAAELYLECLAAL
jgi:glycosyltransferase involved in cell wall biosynthesis